jgi:myo-inositol-1(or 4)-monophosphatase
MTDLEFVEALAREAADIQRRMLNSALTIERKVQDTNLVSEVDRQIDQLLVERLRARFPQSAIVSEEGDLLRSDADDVWYVDPLDGTTNYLHAYPFFAVSIAHGKNRQLVLGVVYDTCRDELFYAEQGTGAFLRRGMANGESTRLHVSQTAVFSDALLSTGFPYDRAVTTDNNSAQFAAVCRRAQGVRRCGSAALDLAYVAAGRLDGHWERGLGPWDAAAGALLVREAGGRVTSRRGEAWSPGSPWTIATNGVLHDELAQVLEV